MSRPIEPTPPLEEEDAERLLESLKVTASPEEIARRRKAGKEFLSDVYKDPETNYIAICDILEPDGTFLHTTVIPYAPTVTKKEAIRLTFENYKNQFENCMGEILLIEAVNTIDLYEQWKKFKRNQRKESEEQQQYIKLRNEYKDLENKINSIKEKYEALKRKFEPNAL